MKQFIAIINGPMGAGKTTVAEILKKKVPNTAFISVDKIKWFVSDFDRTSEQNQVAMEVVMAMSKVYLSNGLSIVYDQGLIKPGRFKQITDLAKGKDIKLFHFRLEAPKEILIERIKNRPKPLLASKKVPLERARTNIDKYFENQKDDGIIFNTTILSPEDVADNIRNIINK